jgi:hypothetical protein
MTMKRAEPRRWQFKARFRRHAFGWRSRPAVQRVREATTEIRKAAPQDPVLAAEGAVTLLERLWAAHEADEIPYIESLADYWGELCASKQVASAWADRLIGITRLALSPDKSVRGHFHGTAACLSALHFAGRAGTAGARRRRSAQPAKRRKRRRAERR